MTRSRLLTLRLIGAGVMLVTIQTILPVFAVVACGYVCGRLNLLGPTAASELNKLVVQLGLPAVLFQVTAEADWSVLWQPWFATSFAVGSFSIFGLTLLARMRAGHHLSDASIDGLNAGYANVGFIGFPLCAMIYGRQSLALVAMATILTASVLFATAIVLVEVGLQTERDARRLIWRVGKSLLSNPLLLAPALGALWSASKLPMPAAFDATLHIIGAAASPCALVSLGLFLAVRYKGTAETQRTALTLTGLKLIAQPAITGALAFGIFRLPAETAGPALLLSALPTGAGPFMIAEFYRREALLTSRTILLSTSASIVTLTLCVVLSKALHP